MKIKLKYKKLDTVFLVTMIISIIWDVFGLATGKKVSPLGSILLSFTILILFFTNRLEKEKN